VSKCEQWRKYIFREANVVQQIIQLADILERILKRYFKLATGNTLIEYVQNFRIEEAKRLLETESLTVDDICNQAGYEDVSFFRRFIQKAYGFNA